MEAYPEYQPSYEGWIGEVPSHWEKTKFKFLLRHKPKKSNISLPCGSISFGTVVYKNSEKLTEEAKLAYQEVLSGEFLVNPLNLNYDLKSLRTALSEISVIVSSGYIVLFSTGESVVEYLKWLLFVFDARQMKTLGAGIRQTITYKDIADCAAYMPSLAEQREIADYLNRETSRIDNLIAEKESFIELLKEKSKVLISHVVTKGLDDSVPVKPSGVEWIDDIPKHWSLFAHKRVIDSIEQGWSPQADSNKPDRGQWGVTKLSAVKNGCFYPLESKAMLDEHDPGKGLKLKNGDFLITRANTPDLVGDICIVSNLTDQKIILCDLIYKLNYTERVSKKYMVYWFLSSPAKSQIKIDAKGASMTMAKISQGKLKEWLMPFPPISEQRQAVEYLDDKVRGIDSLIVETENSISLLKEHRVALISAAVTGKIDVREEM